MSSPKSRRVQRHFSEVLKRDAVHSFEMGRQRVSQICSELQVSPTSVYKWIDKYSTLKSKGIQIVEKKNSQAAEIARLKAELVQTQQALAKKTIRVDYYETVHDRLVRIHGFDVKKMTFDSLPSSSTAPESVSKKTTP